MLYQDANLGNKTNLASAFSQANAFFCVQRNADENEIFLPSLPRV